MALRRRSLYRVLLSSRRGGYSPRHSDRRENMSRRCENREQCWDFRELCEKEERNRDISAKSTDYNGKLSASRDASFFAIDFAHRRTEDREYKSNDRARGEKCLGFLPWNSLRHRVKLVGNLQNVAGEWYPLCEDSTAYSCSAS